jgi:hypothetical protein
VLVEIRRDNRKVMSIKRTRLLKKYNIEKTEELDQLTEKLKQKVSAKTQRLSRYRKRQNQYYHNKLFRTDCKNFITVLSMARIDYQKAFDRVPHSWIIKSLELMGINNKVISFTKKGMTYWKTRM